MGCNSSLSWTLYRDVLITAQRAGIAADADWAEYMREIERLSFKGVLVMAIGTKLTPAQRAEVEQLTREKQARCAVLTDSLVSRGVVTALSWFGVPIKAFARGEAPAALEFLAVAPEHRQDALPVIERVLRDLVARSTGGGAAAHT